MQILCFSPRIPHATPPPPPTHNTRTMPVHRRVAQVSVCSIGVQKLFPRSLLKKDLGNAFFSFSSSLWVFFPLNWFCPFSFCKRHPDLGDSKARETATSSVTKHSPPYPQGDSLIITAYSLALTNSLPKPATAATAPWWLFQFSKPLAVPSK